MRYRSTLAHVVSLFMLAGFALPALAQDFRGANLPAASANGGADQTESFTYVIKLNEQWLQALREGQPLKSTIPAHLRDKVTEIRIEFDGASNSSTTNPASGNDGAAVNNRLGPDLPSGLNRGGISGNGFSPRTSQPSSTNGGFGGNPTTGSVPLVGNDNSGAAWNNTPRAGNTNTGRSNNGIPAFTPPGRTASASNNGLPPLAPRNTTGGNVPRWNPPGQTNPPANNSSNNGWGQGGGQPASTPGGAINPGINNGQPSGGFIPPLRESTGQSGNRSTEVDTAFDGRKAGLAPVNPRYADSRFDGYRPPGNPYPGNNGTTNFVADQQQQRNGSLIAGYQLPAVSGQAPAGWNHGQFERGDRLSDAELARLPAASIPGSNLPQGESVEVRRPGAAPVTTSDSTVARFNGFLYFMLLCSIGLNIYLGLISRGFYVRYRELADELRETFATA